MDSKDIANHSILGFIVTNQIVNEKGDPIEFHDHQFMIDILTDLSPNQVIKKCAQIGGSVTYTLKTLWAAKYRGWNIIYTFPTDSDINEFVSSKTNKIIQANPHVFGGLQTDNIERKEIGDRFVFYKGTISKTAAIMTSADLLIHDEADRSDQSTLETYKSRLKASKFKGRWIFSNPTTEKGVVDNEWKKSDKKEWHITCKKCTFEQMLTFPDSINLETRQYECKACHAELTDDDRRFGKWIATDPMRGYDPIDRPKGFSGYHVSLMMVPTIPAGDIIDDSEGDQEYFYNFVLGEPYNPGDLQVSRATILDNWTPRNLVDGQYYLGVDVGNIKHYALGSKQGLIKVGRFSQWSDLDDMMKFYKPILVIDAMPDNTMSKYFVSAYPSAYMSFFQDNKANPKEIVWWGKANKQGIVYSNRNRVIDKMIDEIVNGRILFGLASDRELQEFVKHYETLRRVKVVDTKGIESFEWQSTTGVDHYVFATLYFYLATLTQGSGMLFTRANSPSIPLVKSGITTGQQLNLEAILNDDQFYSG